MEFFALDDEVLRLEQELAHTCGAGRLNPLLTLAWHMRQRDTRRAVALAQEVQCLLDGQCADNSHPAAATSAAACQPSGTEVAAIQARLTWCRPSPASTSRRISRPAERETALGPAICRRQ